MRNAIKMLKGQWRDFILSGIWGVPLSPNPESIYLQMLWN